MKNHCKRYSTLLLGAMVVFALALGSGAGTALAEEPINLKYAGIWPPMHPMSNAVKLWIEKIEKETDGRVKIKPFWAGALYGPKESALELSKGVADIGSVSGSYARMGFPFEKAMRMAFWGVNDRQMARRIFAEVQEKFPQMGKEYTDVGIKVMAYAGIPPYQLLLAKKKVSSMDDLKGLSLKATGDHSAALVAFGAQGINMPMPECYTALQKTTIDGLLAPFETMKSFRFAEVIDYAAEINLGSAPARHWGFNINSWNKLPKDIQAVFENNIEWLGQKVEELVFAGEETALQVAKENNVEIVKLPQPELDKLYAEVDKVIREKMAALDADGLPGSDVYNEIRRLIKEYSK